MKVKIVYNFKIVILVPGGRKVFLTRSSDNEENEHEILNVNQQPTAAGRSGDRGFNQNRYVLRFHRETDAELKILKEKAYQSIEPVSEIGCEIDSIDFYTPELDFPKRPVWQHGITPAQLNAKEHRYFTVSMKVTW